MGNGGLSKERVAMELKVMTWNVENFFPVGVGAGPKTQAEYDAKLGTLARVIGAQDPDVVALQEVGDDSAHDLPRSIADLAQRLNGKNYAIEVSHHPDGRGIRVAFLLRKTLKATVGDEITDLPTQPPLVFQDLGGKPVTKMGRGAVHVRVQKNGAVLNVITAHLKSKLLEFPHGFSTKDEDLRVRVAAAALARRTAEAAALRMAVTQIRQGVPNEAVIVMGDMNDEPDAATTQMLCGPPGDQPFTKADGKLDGPSFDRKDANDVERLFNVTGFISQDRRYSRVFEGKKELIDHILVSANLVPQLDAAHKRHPVVDSLVDYGAEGPGGTLPSIPEDPHQRQGKPASDHAPVVATFEI
jgi:predicted extracellular nuclease